MLADVDALHQRLGPLTRTKELYIDTRKSHRRSLIAVIAVLAAACLLLSTSSFGSIPRRLVSGAIDELTNASFYRVPEPIPPGAPGQIVRKERLASAPSGAEAWRILYHSTDVLGRDILVSGVVVAPSGRAPAGGRTIVAWGHPTTGAARRCAPSTGIDPFDTIEGLSTLLKAGYAVAATDYSGMGAAGPDSYLIGATEGDNVLDAARAAQNLLGRAASNRLVLWGHSQGGQAVLFAAQQAATYAPGLRVLAVAVAAPATDLGALLADDIGTVSGVTIASYAFNAYSNVYGASEPDARLTTILTPAGAAATPEMAALCLFGQQSELHALARPLVGHYLAGDPRTTLPWSSLLTQNTPGAVKLTAPLFIAQGQTDTLVHPASTARFAAHERSLGTAVTYDFIPKTGHGLVALRAIPALMKWLAKIAH